MLPAESTVSGQRGFGERNASGAVTSLPAQVAGGAGRGAHSCLIINRLIRQRPEIANEIRRNRRGKSRWLMTIPIISSAGSLFHEVPNPPFQPYCPGVAAIPSRLVTILTPKPQPRLSQRPGNGDAAFCSAVSWSVVIVSTEGRDRMSLTAVFAFAQQHLAEGEKIIDGRNQSAAAVGKRRRSSPLTIFGVIVEHQGSRRGIHHVESRQPVELAGRNTETGVFHAQGLEDSLA